MKIQIAFYKAHQPKADWQDKLIAWWTNGPYSHVELILSDNMYSTSPRDGCVRSKPHFYNNSTWDYVDVEINNLDKILDFYNQTKGLKYDWAGILGFVAPFADREDRYFCSEWCTKALIIAGVGKLYKIEPSKTSPNRLYKLLTGR